MMRAFLSPLRPVWLLMLLSLVSVPVFSATQSDTQSQVSNSGDVRQTSTLGNNDESLFGNDAAFTPWQQDDSVYRKKLKTKVEVKKVTKKHYITKKLKGVVPPIHFDSGKADIPEEYINKLRKVLHDMRERTNVRLHFVGHSDNVKLFGAAKKKYGDNLGLSRERAGTAAEYFQKALHLPPEAISYEGVGDTKPIADNRTEAGRSQNRRVEVEVWYDEVDEQSEDKKIEVKEKLKRIKVCRVETMCMLHYKAGHSRRTVLKNLVPPLHYNENVADIPQQFLSQLKQALQNLKDKSNVQLRFIGYTDNTPLSGRDLRIYGDSVGLSKANARRVALAVQDALHLPSEAIASTGKGDAYPLASNNSEKGRALNRRVEVEFWHDDPLEDLPDTPQICPEASAAETVERIYNPPDGDIKPIYFNHGKPVIPDGYAEKLKRNMAEIADKGNVRLRFIGYTSNKRLDRRTAMVYGDDVGLSTSRARRAMEVIKQQLGLSDKQAEFEGRGYVQSNDVVNTGFVELDQSKVEVQIVYDELAVLDENEGVAIQRITRDVKTQYPFALNLMRISVDGQPINDPGKNIADVQRCTDVALDKAQVKFKYDNLDLKPRLNITAWPNVISREDSIETAFVDNRVQFKMYSNYPSFIKRAEVRIFDSTQSTRDKPLAVVPLNSDGYAQWLYPDEKPFHYSTPRTEYQYVLRVYGKAGNFDETAPQSLWVVNKLDTDYSSRNADKELLVGYGENRLALDNIRKPRSSGTVSVQGSHVPDGYQVWFGGNAVPVNDKGEYGAELILPQGMHTVEVAITDASGNGDVYLRDLVLKNHDWFTVGIADLTLAQNRTNGPAALVTGDTTHYDNDLTIDGRLAYYTKGQFGNNWKLTSSADTREGPVKDLFSNFLDKSPDAVFRRIDADYYYPTYGDDATVEEDAPTSGKFYLKMEKDHTYGLWGNFNAQYNDTNLAQVDRALYGANINYEPNETTQYGEKRYRINAFAAEPGTLAARDEFRGTDGSLYYLKRQDILTGSDRLRVEVRDAVTGMVVGVKNLVHGLDYDIDYIQGRILLSEPLSAFAPNNLLVNTGDLSGYQTYLVAQYEYTPGFENINDIASGGRVHYWWNDHIKIGVTAENQDSDGSHASLDGVDVTMRKNPGTWLRIEKSVSNGLNSSSLTSNDGGLSFQQPTLATNTNVKAGAQRLDASVRLQEITDKLKGKLTFYRQDMAAGYSAPGQNAATDTSITGGSVQVQADEYSTIKLDVASRTQKDALKTTAGEIDLQTQVNDHWRIDMGVRHDYRNDHSSLAPLTQEEGYRNDLATRLTYDTHKRWSAYGFGQHTLQISGNRDNNNRAGVGGEYRTSDRFKLNGELSDGGLGSAARLGTEYKMSDKTNLYSAYTLENERTDNGVRARQGNFTTGFKSRYNDSASMFMEEKYTYGEVPTGLTHSMGFDLAATDRLNIGANLDLGTLRDYNTAAEIKRKAAGMRLGYHFDALTYAGALEYRLDTTQQANTTTSDRTTWLMKNSFKYLLNPNWRMIGKLNHSISHSTLGDFYDGNFTEAVLGYAYRPINNNALNALFKYTYFFNLPASDQLALSNTAAEFIQKSQILSLDVMYDITQPLSIGAKYAYRLGQLSEDRVNPQFYESDASLVVLRTDWHVVHKWDVMVEGRLLDLPQAGDRRSGFLVGMYRQVGDNIKAGIGYNFTDFSDDLTDLSYDSRGFFINVIGKF